MNCLFQRSHESRQLIHWMKFKYLDGPIRIYVSIPVSSMIVQITVLNNKLGVMRHLNRSRPSLLSDLDGAQSMQITVLDIETHIVECLELRLGVELFLEHNYEHWNDLALGNSGNSTLHRVAQFMGFNNFIIPTKSKNYGTLKVCPTTLIFYIISKMITTHVIIHTKINSTFNG